MTEERIKQLERVLEQVKKEDYAKQMVINELREVIRLIIYEIKGSD